MSDEPVYVRQTKVESTEQAKAWWNDARQAASVQGCVFFRFSIHDDDPDLILIEGWRAQPDDQGKPRFETTSADVSEAVPKPKARRTPRP
ncbi:hypothetical protein [Kaistia sp. MMO-174]|uniref:hypothetical protein n=1 Tax=Kaistia sp. MMO-174 TaxID=3081256 RepID=UPI0030173EA9